MPLGSQSRLDDRIHRLLRDGLALNGVLLVSPHLDGSLTTRDVESEPETAVVQHGDRSLEPKPDLAQILFRDADSVVPNDESDVPVAGRYGELDGLSGSVFDGVERSFTTTCSIRARSK